MIEEDRPFWLRGQEHGVLAEARTRAFLLERFWILERSVDIEGADFIIQRRITQRSLLDRIPPRLGFVQSKFFADQNSTQYVHREYVVDSEGQSRSEFFLMCHSGKENSASAYFLSASDILASFRVAEASHSKAGCFIMPGREIMTQRFLVLDQRSILDQMEQTLKNADFQKNRRFLSWALPLASRAEAPLKEEYLEPIDNWWGDIPKKFLEMRRLAGRAQLDIEEVLEKLRTIENSDDPEFALEVAEDLQSSFGNSVRIPDDLFNEDFLNAVKYHKGRHNQLKQAGLLNAYAALRRIIFDFVINDLAPRMPLPGEQVYLVDVKYDAATFMKVHVGSRLSTPREQWPQADSSWRDKDVPDTRGIIDSKPGDISGYLLPGRYGYFVFKSGKHIENPAPWPEKIINVAEMVAATIAEKILELRFGEL